MTDEAWIDTVRLARDFGTVRELLPEGIDDVRDMPHTLFDAIGTAQMFLSWEELPKDERPPKGIWLNGKKLTAWFEEVERKRKAEYGGKGDPGPIEDPVENDAAKGLIVG